MVNTIKKSCAAALLAATTYTVYTCVGLEQQWTRLAEDGNEIRKIQDSWSLLSLGGSISLDEAVRQEIENNPQKDIIKQKSDELATQEAALQRKKPYFSNEDTRLEDSLRKLEERVGNTVQADTQQLGRLRLLMDYEGPSRNYLAQLTHALILVDQIRDGRKREEERLRLQRQREEEERTRKYYEELYRRISGTESKITSYQKFVDAILTENKETIIGLQSLSISEPYTDLSWIDQFLETARQQTYKVIPGKNIMTGSLSDLLEEGKHIIWGNEDIRGQFHVTEYFLQRPIQEHQQLSYTIIYKWPLSDTIEKVEDKSDLINKFLSQEIIEETHKQTNLFLEFWQVQDGTCRIGQCGVYNRKVIVKKKK